MFTRTHRWHTARKHAINFPSEEIALALGLARPAARRVREYLAGAQSSVFACKVCAPRDKRRDMPLERGNDRFPQTMRGRAPCPLGLRDGFLSSMPVMCNAVCVYGG